jgi:hypothetical protein
MAQQRKSATATDRAGRSLSGNVREALLEAGAEKLKKLSKAVGNDAMANKVAGNDRLRDELLSFIHARLDAIHLAQQAEIKAMRERKLWFRRMVRGEKGLSLPEPTRWAAPALLYKKASEAICAGELGRGADLLKQASEADRATFKAAPKQLGLKPEEKKGAKAPASAAAVEAGEGCTPAHAPKIEALAARIANVTESMDAVGHERRRAPHNWWEQAEDEEETKKEKQRKSKRLAEPAAAKDAAARGEYRGAMVEPRVAREVRVEAEAPVEERKPARSRTKKIVPT